MLNWTDDEVADFLRGFTGEECACNINGIDEWLLLKCKFAKSNECPEPSEENGCWREFVKHVREEQNV